MAHSLSARKRVRQNIKRRALNRFRKRSYRTLIRQYRESLLHGSIEQCEDLLRQLYKRLDQVAAKGTIHPNKASRYKQRLAARLNARKAHDKAREAQPTG